jgi:hypothetical protein
MSRPDGPQRDGVADHAAEPYEVVPDGAVEPKTKAAAIGGGAGGVVAGAVLWGMDELWWNGAASPDVPAPLAALVWLAIPAAVAFLSSYVARHVNRVP